MKIILLIRLFFASKNGEKVRIRWDITNLKWRKKQKKRYREDRKAFWHIHRGKLDNRSNEDIRRMIEG